MTVQFKDLDCLEKYNCFDQYIRATLTGDYLLDTIAKDLREHISDPAVAEKLYTRFTKGISMVAHEAEVRAALAEKTGEIAPEALRLGLVNDAILHTCENIYSKMHDKITPKNCAQTLKRIQDDYLNAKDSFVEER